MFYSAFYHVRNDLKTRLIAVLKVADPYAFSTLFPLALKIREEGKNSIEYRKILSNSTTNIMLQIS